MAIKQVPLKLLGEVYVQTKFREFINRLKRAQKKGVFMDGYLESVKGKVISQTSEVLSEEDVQLSFAKSLILDLLFQGWFIKTVKGELFLAHDSNFLETLTRDEAKEKVRNGHLLARNSQLQEPSVSEFITKMERRKHTSKGWVSIFSLMRDGQELAKSLKDLRSKESHLEELGHIIKPYIQFVEAGVKCERTGIPLTDIWRYFRHTWITEYKSLPGRSSSILIRDAAVDNHPVIGIAALGSSMAQLSKRDVWIGWNSETFVNVLKKNPRESDILWITKILEELISELYISDLLKEGFFELNELEQPSDDLIRGLKEKADEAKRLHIRFPHEAKKAKSNDTLDWQQKSETHLFKSKRYSSLAELLKIRQVFQKYKCTESVECLTQALEYAEFRNSLGKLVRRRKGQRVGIDIMDIVVCGSIAPYNHILGGKLVCLLLTSPEIVNYYNSKYGRKESVIASSMAGKPVVRKPKLSFLSTTSLYGTNSSQYNRIKLPTKSIGNVDNGEVRYINLGISEGFGSFHFSKETLTWGNQLVGRRKGGRRVNSIFGEGANPLLRKIREAIEMIGLESEPVLKHESKRIIYGISLVKNLKEVLLGYQSEPKYLIDSSNPESTTAKIVDYWVQRWLINRIKKDGVLQNVAEHTKAYPVTHGARAPLYKLVAPDEDLFSDQY